MAEKRTNIEKKCFLRECGNKSTTKKLIFHKFPRNIIMREKWMERCNITLKQSKYALICSEHFTKDDYLPTRVDIKKRLKKNVVPVVNKTDSPHQKTEKSGPNILRTTAKVLKSQIKSNMNATQDDKIVDTRVNDGENIQDSLVDEGDLRIESESTQYSIGDSLYDTPVQNFVNECEDVPNADSNGDDENQQDIEKDVEMLNELQKNTKFQSSNITKIDLAKVVQKEDSGKEKKLNLVNLIKTNEDMIAFTGLTFELLNSLTEVLENSEDKMYSKKFSNSIRDRIVLCFCKLRLNLSFRSLAVLFGMKRQSCAHNFYYMIDLLAQILKDIIHWPTHEQIMNSIPRCFRAFPNTYVVLDCTEVPVERPDCLKCRLRLYSHYKGCETIKLLIGVAPCGVITYVSNAYGGRASDKAIFNQSDLLRRLEPTRDAIMVDKGFDIEFDCTQNFIKLIIPPKLSNKKQLSAEETILTNKIATARVHVERAIQRLKMFKILKHKMSWYLIPYIDKIVTVIAGIVNLKEPLLAENKF